MFTGWSDPAFSKQVEFCSPWFWLWDCESFQTLPPNHHRPQWAFLTFLQPTNQKFQSKNVPRGGLEGPPLQEDPSITSQWQDHARQGIMRQFLQMNQSQQAWKFPNPVKYLPKYKKKASSQFMKWRLMSSSLRWISFRNHVIATTGHLKQSFSSSI